MKKQLNKSEIQKYLSNLYWDINIDKDSLYNVFTGKKKNIYHVDKINLYVRLLMSYDWYLILKIVPKSNLKELLQDKVINSIKVKELRNRYLYVRKFL